MATMMSALDTAGGEGGAGGSEGGVFVFPLSYAQERMWFIYKLHPSLYTMQLLSWRLTGRLDETALQRALDEIIGRHEILRTSFPEADGQPVQRVVASLSVPLEVRDASAATDREAEARRIIEQAALDVFDLSRLPLLRPLLIRLGEGDHVLTVLTHHILADGWSLRIFQEELASAYEASCAGRRPDLPELPVQYADYAIWERECLKTGAFDEHLKYWRGQLGKSPPPLRLPADRAPSAAPTYAGGKQDFQLPPELGAAIQAFCRSEGVTLYVAMLAAFEVLLHRYSGQTDICVGTVTANRGRAELEHLVGFFVNTLVLRVDVAGDPTFRALLHHVRDVVLEAFANQDLPYDCLVDDLQPERGLGENPLFQVAFSRQEELSPNRRLPDLTATDFRLQGNLTRFDLELHVFDTPAGVKGLVVYSTDRFDNRTIQRMLGHYQQILRSIIEHPSARVSEIGLLTPAERARLLGSRAPAPASGGEQTEIHRRFEALAARTPDAVAIQGGGRALTYRELDADANRLARHLMEVGVAPGALVAVALRPSPEGAQALLAVLKAGAAVVPVDPDDPLPYQARQVEGLELAAWVVGAGAALPDGSAGRVIDLDRDRGAIVARSAERPAIDVGASRDALLWASSARRLVIDHRALAARVDTLRGLFPLSSDDVVSWRGVWARAAGWELLLALTAGARVAVPGPGMDHRALADDGVTVACLAAPELARLVEAAEADAALGRRLRLRLVLCQGEPLPADLARRFFAVLPGELWFIHGRPEVGPAISAHACRHVEPSGFSPLGAPCPGAVIAVLDTRRRELPVGIVGDVFVGGDALARPLAAGRLAGVERLVEVTLDDGRTMRLVRTGERGRWAESGEILELVPERASTESHHLGATCFDRDEIEAALLEQAGVRECAVLLKDRIEGTRSLVAYVTTEDQDADRIADFARARLPAAMCPSAYVLVNRLPRDAAGRIEREALAALPVLDVDLAMRWEERLRALPEIEEPAVVIRDAVSAHPPLHLSDLLPTGAALAPAQARAHAASGEGGAAPAIVEVPRLPEGDEVLSVGWMFERAAAEAGVRGITFIEASGAELRWTYAELLERGRRVAGALRAAGLGPHDKVLLQIEMSHELLAVFCGCMLAGIVPVPVAIAPSYDPTNAVAAKLVNVWQMLERPLIVAGERVAGLIRALGAEIGLEDLRIAAAAELLKHPPDVHAHVPAPDDLALLLLTSGSTGLPKAVMQTHRMIVRRSMGAAQQLELTRDDVSLNWMPLDHVGGLVMYHLRDVLLGCEQIHVHTEVVLRDPLRWLDLMDRYRVTNTWAPNFAFALINDRAEEVARRSWDLSGLRMILNGGESIVPRTARRFLRLLGRHGLRHDAIYPGWGMTETTSGVAHSSRFNLDTTSDSDAFVDIGPPIRGVALRVVGTNDEVLEEGAIGHLQIMGETVMPGYFGRPELNREIFTSDRWFCTGDLAFLKDGRLTITGRIKDEIIINGLNFFPHEIEATVEQTPGVETSSTAACAARTAGSQTDDLVIFFSLSRDTEDALQDVVLAIRRAVAENFGVNPKFLVPIPRAALPRTGIGKIRRVELKGRFEAGEFKDLVKRVDLLLGTSQVVPRWFYRPTWERREAALRAAGPSAQARTALVFLDRDGLGAAMGDRLRAAGLRCIAVTQGDELARGEADRYTLRPGDEDQAKRLFDGLAADGVRVDLVLHLFTYAGRPSSGAMLEDLRDAQERGVFSLLALVQALARTQGPRSPVALRVVSCGVQAVHREDPIAAADGTLPGFLRTLASEVPWLDCRHIDLDPSDPEAHPAALFEELGLIAREPEVAYRRGQRLVPAIEELDFTAEPRALPFQRGALYLVTGGLGGIGAHVSRMLLERHGVRLLLVGRTALPPRERWDGLDRGDGLLARRVRALRSLEQLGDVLYEAAPVERLEAIERAVSAAERRWDTPLAGALHLAGHGSLEAHLQGLDDHRILNASRASFEQMFSAKVAGTWSLLELCRSRPGAVVIAFSSVNGVFGAPTLGAYSAANSFIDACIQRAWRAGRRVVSFDWSMWDDVGMSEGGRTFAEGMTASMGNRLISIQEGLDSTLVGLTRDEPQILVGVTGDGPSARRSLDAPIPRQEIAAFIVSSGGALPGRALGEISLADRFGVASACRCTASEELPRGPDGEVDRAALLGLRADRGDATTPYAQPETEVERRIAAIWEEVLGAKRVGLDDNFFDLGGNSLLTIRVKSLVESAFQIELPVVDMFKHPTVRTLAMRVEKPAPAVDLDEAQGRADARKKAFERRRGARSS